MPDQPALLVLGALVLLIVLAAAILFVVLSVRAHRRRDGEALARQVAEPARLHGESATRMEAMRDLISGRQAELHRAVNERLDSVSHHLNQSMTSTRQHTVESLQKLG